MAAEPAAHAEQRSWRRLAALFAVASFAETFGFGHFAAFTPLYLEQLGVAAADVPRWTGLLAAATFVLGLPLAPLWGVWADKYSRKLIIVRSAAGEALVFLVAALSQNVWHLLVARMLVGFILGNTGVMYAVLAAAAPRQQLGFAIALVQTGGLLGQSVGPLVGGLLVGWLGISGLFALDSVIALGVAALLVAGYREERARPRDPRPVRAMLLALPAALRAAPPVLPLYGVQLLLLLGLQMTTPFVPLLVSDLYAGDDLPLMIGLVMTSFGVAAALCTALWGRIGDRVGRRRALQVAVVLSSLTLVAQAVAPDLATLLIARTLQGVFQAAVAPLVVALVAAVTPEAVRASVLNLSQFPFYLGSIAGGTLGALIAARGSQAVFLAAAGGILVASSVLARLPGAQRPAQASDGTGAGG